MPPANSCVVSIAISRLLGIRQSDHARPVEQSLSGGVQMAKRETYSYSEAPVTVFVDADSGCWVDLVALFPDSARSKSSSFSQR